ncbi:MAG: hypothetical protein M3299_01130 [Thermoproteota archaeon]|nr:hypothetical protein [Thermoproteota archaeon]
MQKGKKDQIVKRQKEHQQQLQLSSRQLNSHHDDALWHQTPEMGTEALIATLDSNRKLQKALVRGVMKRKKLYREKSLPK